MSFLAGLGPRSERGNSEQVSHSNGISRASALQVLMSLPDQNQVHANSAVVLIFLCVDRVLCNTEWADKDFASVYQFLLEEEKRQK